jgi:hypothetical protein
MAADIKKILLDIKPFTNPYVSQPNIIKSWHMSRGTVKTVLDEIEKEIERKTYTPYAILRNDRLVYCDYYVFVHYLKYRSKFKEKNLRKFVPPFGPEEIKLIAAGLNLKEETCL